jgi:hypothetical protein
MFIGTGPDGSGEKMDSCFRRNDKGGGNCVRVPATIVTSVRFGMFSPSDSWICRVISSTGLLSISLFYILKQ